MRQAMLTLLLAFLMVSVQAQQNKKTQKKQVASKTVAKSKPVQKSNAPAISLNSSSAYPAFATRPAGPALSPGQAQISDPTLRAMIRNTTSTDVRKSRSGVVGMPKGSYGFANGHLTLYTTGTTTSGSMTGNGAVGTGSSVGTLGANGLDRFVNGKSPDAGSGIWGNRILPQANKKN
jgi:hypothetical protein